MIHWRALDTVAYKGKQDDIFFVTPSLGFYGNGAGKIYKTSDGGLQWRKVWDHPGTYVRALGFIDDKHGFAGNIGTDYFPGVTDTAPLYETLDGGETWHVATISGAKVKGLCAIDVLHVPAINAGVLSNKVVLHAAGRVGGPTVLVTSLDEGQTWVASDMSAYAGMILDVKFLDRQTGFICAASSAEVEQSHALILKTVDGGKTWEKKYESQRPFEDAWKCAFPSRNVGYATVQSYDENSLQRYVVKTIDSGETWTELPLVEDAKVREFGIGFLDENIGWVGAAPHGFQTQDGGKRWTAIDFGNAVNKIRVLHTTVGVTAYAIGTQVYKFESK